MSQVSRARYSQVRGFTLIELLVVITMGSVFILSPILSISLSTTPVAIAKIKLSNDSFDDLVAIRGGTTTANNILEIRKTDAVGNFVASPETLTIASGTKRLLVADLDHDLDPDILTLHDRGTNSALLGIVRSNGVTLSPQTTVGLGSFTQPIDFASADINADGFPDVVAVSAYSVQDYTLSILKSTGPTTFAAPLLMHLPVSQSSDLAPKQARLVLSPGSLAETKERLLATEDSGDSSDSAVSGAGMSLRSVTGLRAVALADLLGSSLPDLVVAGADFGGSFVRVLENTPSGFVFRAQMIIPEGGAPEALATADFNRDGLIDIALADSSNNSVTVFRNLGGGAFAAGEVSPTGASPVALTVADLDNDYYPDLIASTQAGTVGGGALSSITVLINRRFTASTGFIISEVGVANIGAGPAAAVVGNFSPGGNEKDVVVMNVWLKTLTELVQTPLL